MENLRIFELLENLLPEGEASAVLLEWSGKSYIASRKTIELHEFVGTHGNRGDRGYCFFSPQSKRWETVSGLYQQVPARGIA